MQQLIESQAPDTADAVYKCTALQQAPAGVRAGSVAITTGHSNGTSLKLEIVTYQSAQHVSKQTRGWLKQTRR